MQNITNSLLLPDKTLQFVKDHPLMADPVLPIGQGPRLTSKDVNYTQIVVERVTALDNSVYDVLFTATGECLRRPCTSRIRLNYVGRLSVHWILKNRVFKFDSDDCVIR